MDAYLASQSQYFCPGEVAGLKRFLHILCSVLRHLSKWQT